MREFVRLVAAALSVACLAAAIVTAPAGEALAQATPAPPQQTAPPTQTAPAPGQPVLKQIALTDKQIEGVLAAQKDMDVITAKFADNATLDPRITAQLEDAARKNGFAGYDEYSNVVDNISIVLAGFDPATKQYVGTDVVIKAQIAKVEADKKMSPNDKKEALAELNDALKSPVPIENKGNIDLVAKYYDKLADALGDDQE
jgi:hypothetical protein